MKPSGVQMMRQQEDEEEGGGEGREWERIVRGERRVRLVIRTKGIKVSV